MTMKSPARFGPQRSPSWAQLATPVAACALCFGCESSSPSDAPRAAATVKAHPAFGMPKTPEMRDDPGAAGLPSNDAPRPKPHAKRDKKDWQQSCKIQRACQPESKEIPTCDVQVPQRPWVDVVTQGDALLDKEVLVSGTLGLSLIKKTGSGTCAPGACCHTLEMQIVLVGEPTGSLPLLGLTCSGDDSALCCSVPAESQAVVARGRLQRAAAGLGKWQLRDPALCLIDNTPRH